VLARPAHRDVSDRHEEAIGSGRRFRDRNEAIHRIATP